MKLSYHPAKFNGLRESGSRDIMVFVSHVTLQVHLMKVFLDFIGGSSSKYVTILTSLVALGTVIVEI